MPRRAVSGPLLLIAAGGLALVLPPLLLRAQPQDWPTVRAEVTRMPQAERDRLNRNTSEYLQLSDAERQRYRELHATLEKDAQDGRGQLRQTLNDYTAWLATNHAYDRQLLLTTTDPQARVAEMQRIVRERDQALSRPRRWRSGIWMRFGVPDLTADELIPLMNIVENGLAFNSDDREKLRDENGHEKAGVARYFALIGILRDRGDNLERVLDRD
ncbi:MAG: hypothetical protein WD176_03795, partial [Pirellulales bacterium]